MRKKILFVINTFSRAGAEMALLDLLRKLDEMNEEHGKRKYDISLLVYTSSEICSIGSNQWNWMHFLSACSNH